MLQVLMVAEKPSLAESIARILSDCKMTTRRSVACNVYEYQGTFRGKPAAFKVTAVMGHVYSLDFPREYNNWHAVEPVELFAAPTVKMEANPKAHVVKHLQVESKGVDVLVLWLDCDREGENICFEVIKVAQLQMSKAPEGSRKRDNVHRARFSAITAVDIKKAMNSLVKPNENEAKAVDVRQELDLKIGCAFTRYQTKFFQGKYGNLDSSLISFGPCRLALCVKRHDEILSFVPRKYWTLLTKATVLNETLTLTSVRGPMYERRKALDICESLKNIKQATVTKVVTEKKSTQRPAALNTVELLKACSTKLGIGPQQTMHIAERLYMQGFVSYPRTETSKYPLNFDLKGVLHILAPHNLWGSEASALLQTGFDRPEGGKDVGDHPPITPMALATEYDLAGDSWRVYDYICRHFIGSLSPNCKYLRTQLTITVGQEEFQCTGKRIVTPGFTSVMHWRDATADEDDDSLPAGIEDMKGKDVDLAAVTTREGETTPPDYLTESDLIGLMEKLGIGTDASMAVHISNICERRYVSVQGNRRFMVPSNLGIVLIHGYQKIDAELALPSLRANMENKINLIAEGKAADITILSEEVETYGKKFENFVAKIANMDELFEATFSPLAGSGKIFSKCGKCRRYTHMIALRPQRLHCRTCNETYSLPQTGNIKLYKELKCPLDGFELVLYSTGSKGKGYPLCPQCYNHPPLPGVEEAMGCNTCPNEQCPHSVINSWVTLCPEERCTGMLVLDATSAPRWKLCCNKCSLVSSFNDTVHQVELVNLQDGLKHEYEDCESCLENGAKTRLVRIVFGKKSGKDDIEDGCIACDEEVASLLDTQLVRLGKPRSFRGRGRGRRGRRGRGGRSRGRGRGDH